MLPTPDPFPSPSLAPQCPAQVCDTPLPPPFPSAHDSPRRFAIAIPPLLVVYFFIQRYYIPTARELQRIESITRSPIYSKFGEALNGVPTIRAYRKEQHYTLVSRGKGVWEGSVGSMTLRWAYGKEQHYKLVHIRRRGEVWEACTSW